MPPRRRPDVQSQGWQQWWVLAPARELDPVIPVCVAGRPSQYAASAYFRRKFAALFRESSPKCFSQRRPPARYCQESASVTSRAMQVWPSQEFSKMDEERQSPIRSSLQHDEGMALAVQSIHRLRASGGNRRGVVGAGMPTRKDQGQVGRK
ncbi:unnamed protein product [Symbiodinium microadriaticum]|nr:unnamed protein product [Symbiodinium microadriaticum]CAE7947420.1 unnamed protein product [Symbiodinium sp. KB8]